MMTGISELDTLIHSFNLFPPNTQLYGYDHDMKHSLGFESTLCGTVDKLGKIDSLHTDSYHYLDCAVVNFRQDDTVVQIDASGRPYLEIYVFAEVTWEQLDDGFLEFGSNWWEGDVRFYIHEDFHNSALLPLLH